MTASSISDCGTQCEVMFFNTLEAFDRIGKLRGSINSLEDEGKIACIAELDQLTMFLDLMLNYAQKQIVALEAAKASEVSVQVDQTSFDDMVCPDIPPMPALDEGLSQEDDDDLDDACTPRTRRASQAFCVVWEENGDGQPTLEAGRDGGAWSGSVNSSVPQSDYFAEMVSTPRLKVNGNCLEIGLGGDVVMIGNDSPQSMSPTNSPEAQSKGRPGGRSSASCSFWKLSQEVEEKMEQAEKYQRQVSVSLDQELAMCQSFELELSKLEASMSQLEGRICCERHCSLKGHRETSSKANPCCSEDSPSPLAAIYQQQTHTKLQNSAGMSETSYSVAVEHGSDIAIDPDSKRWFWLPEDRFFVL